MTAGSFCTSPANRKIFELLVRHGANLDWRNSAGNTLLHAALRVWNTGITLLLIRKYGADMNARNEKGQTPLHLATEYCFFNQREVAFMVRQGADLMAGDGENSSTPLHYAAKNGYVKRAALFLRYGVPVDVRNANDKTPLHDAVLNTTEETASEMIRFLVKKGADINARDFQGRTPLHEAAEECLEKAVKILLKLGADKSIEDDKETRPSSLPNTSAPKRSRLRLGKRFWDMEAQ